MPHLPYALDGPGAMRHASCRRPFSFYFDLIEPHFGGARHLAKPMHCLCSLARKMGVRSYVFERLGPFEEWDEELEALRARFAAGRGGDAAAAALTSEAHRVTFLRSPVRVPPAAVQSRDVLGYAVIVSITRPDRGRAPWPYVLRGAVRRPERGPGRRTDGGRAAERGPTNYYVHCYRAQRTAIGPRSAARRFTFPGVFFCQQNDLTHICAHAALRVAVNSAPFVRGELTNARINGLLGIDHRSKAVGRLAGDPPGRDGQIDVRNIRRVGERLGFGVQWFDFLKRPEVAYADWSYSSVESGFPVILSIDAGGKGHVVTVLGHTFNSDRWTPVAQPAYERHATRTSRELDRYISAVRYADHFVIVDDNLGVNLTLPAEALHPPRIDEGSARRRRGRKGRRARPAEIVSVAGIALTPDVVRSTGYFAELVAMRLVKDLLSSAAPDGCRWRDMLLHSREELVGRTIFQARGGYLTYLRRLRDSEGHGLAKGEADRLVRSLPDDFWVTEVSLPDLLSANRRKLGDVLCMNDETRLNKADDRALATPQGRPPGLAPRAPRGAAEPSRRLEHQLELVAPVARAGDSRVAAGRPRVVTWTCPAPGVDPATGARDMLVQPNRTTVLATVTGVSQERRHGDTVVSLCVESNVSPSAASDFIRPAAGSTLRAYSIDPVPVRVGQRVLARARLNAGPRGGRVVLESVEAQ